MNSFCHTFCKTNIIKSPCHNSTMARLVWYLDGWICLFRKDLKKRSNAGRNLANRDREKRGEFENGLHHVVRGGKS